MVDKTKILKKHFELNDVNAYFLDKSRMLKSVYDAMDEYAETKFNNVALADVSGSLVLTKKDAEIFFNEIMQPKEANDALKKAMLKFITH